MSRYIKILAALFGLAALPLFTACDDGPTGPHRETLGEKDAVRVIPEWNSIAVGERLRLQAILPRLGDGGQDEAEKLKWESSNPTVAIVSDAGLVRGLEPGNVLITAEFAGYRGSAHVTIREGEQVDDRDRYLPEDERKLK